MPHHRHVRPGGIDMHIAEQGEGPLVLLLHGFPESWYAWRHQIDALAAAGYRVVAPDQRGYGSTDRPDGADQYSIFHLVGDVVALIRELGEEQAVVVGHDWGSTVAWHTAMLRPDLVRGVVGISVPPAPRGALPPLTVSKKRFGEGFYQNYFQEPGVAEAGLGADIAATMRMTFGSVRNPEPTEGFLGLFLEPEALPAWLTEEDLAVFVEQFTASGFTGGLNWYRNLDRNWELTAPWQDAPITPPSLYISGENDIVRAFYKMDEAAWARVPNLRGIVDVPQCGHWTQQERPEVVTDAVLEFLRGL
ncbi:alpha/beta fold hydrolase [Streptomyces sp. NPDC006012]|uniref:alpha/beta fold hydrolase n=1 Tax=Streptomyces sp. NPDC006012 TaxID=3364739 RepID=UPI0036A38537